MFEGFPHNHIEEEQDDTSPSPSTFWTRYRIVQHGHKDSETKAYSVQVWRFYWPFWSYLQSQDDKPNVFWSIQEAEKYIWAGKTTVVKEL